MSDTMAPERAHSLNGATDGRGLSVRLKAQAYGLGFDLAGITSLGPVATADAFEDWLARGYHGEMQYLPRGAGKRRDSRLAYEGATTAIVVAMSYGGAEPPGPVARYARGDDYHDVMTERLTALHRWLETELGRPIRGKPYVDTGPILERDLARRAGLGWFGKNTMLINKDRGSFFFLAALLTNLELTPDPPHEASHCGTCTACLGACPTDAFPAPGVLDARRCVSYLTIELRGPIPVGLREGVGDRLFGCDDCQDVCPWNRRAGPGTFPTDPALATLDPVELLSLTEAEFRRRFRHTALMRAKRSGLLRNAAVVLGNVGDERALPALERAAQDADGVIADAARWAIGRVRQRTSSR